MASQQHHFQFNWHPKFTRAIGTCDPGEDFFTRQPLHCFYSSAFCVIASVPLCSRIEFSKELHATTQGNRRPQVFVAEWPTLGIHLNQKLSAGNVNFLVMSPGFMTFSQKWVWDCCRDTVRII